MIDGHKSPPRAWSRFLSAYAAAVLGSSLAGAVISGLIGLLVGGGGDLDDFLDLLLFSAVYALPSVTILGPLGFLLLRREGYESRRAYAVTGGALGAVGMIAVGALDSMAMNPLILIGAGAGVVGALAFRRVWLVSARSA